MSEKQKKSKKIPPLYLPTKVHHVMARLVNKSEDQKNYPNLSTFMSEFREPFVLAMALGTLESSFVDDYNEEYKKEGKIKTVGSEAIHSEWDTIIRAISYWWEHQKNKDTTHNILVNPRGMKDIAEKFAIAGFHKLDSLLQRNSFRDDLIEEIEEIIESESKEN